MPSLNHKNDTNDWRVRNETNDEAYPYINEAKYEGVIESNLPDNLLWDNEVQAVLNWKNSYRN